MELHHGGRAEGRKKWRCSLSQYRLAGRRRRDVRSLCLPSFGFKWYIVEIANCWQHGIYILLGFTTLCIYTFVKINENITFSPPSLLFGSTNFGFSLDLIWIVEYINCSCYLKIRFGYRIDKFRWLCFFSTQGFANYKVSFITACIVVLKPINGRLFFLYTCGPWRNWGKSCNLRIWKRNTKKKETTLVSYALKTCINL